MDPFHTVEARGAIAPADGNAGGNSKYETRNSPEAEANFGFRVSDGPVQRSEEKVPPSEEGGYSGGTTAIELGPNFERLEGEALKQFRPKKLPRRW